MKDENYLQHKDKVISNNRKYKHIMAISLNPKTNYRDGLIRCIAQRQGDVEYKGFIDYSKLSKVVGKSLYRFNVEKEIKLQKERLIIKRLGEQDWQFLGPEDPDIWYDKKTDLIHLYFTMPFKNIKEKMTVINLGHAIGKDLESLEMTPPVLTAAKDSKEGGAKEVSIAPLNSKGFRFNLIESSRLQDETRYSVIQVAIAESMNRPWKFGKIVFHPAEHNLSWIAGHASPGPLLPKSFINIGKDKRLGIINGREANRRINGKTKYGQFTVGLFIYNFEKGEIEWVSKKPFISDTQARTITFASDFVQNKKREGLLYAHVDDSFVRTYTLFADKIKQLLPFN